MSIRSKLTVLFLAAALIPLLLVSLLTFNNYKNSLEKAHISYLENLAVFKADRIETYFTRLKAEIEIAKTFYNVKKNLPILIQFTAEPDNPEFIAAKEILDEQLQWIQPILGLFDIMLVNAEGRVVYASNPGHYPKDLLRPLPDPQQKAFAEGRSKVYFSDVFRNKEEDNRLGMLVTAPVFDFDNIFIGEIVFEVDMHSISHLMQDVTGLGHTGETLVGKRVGNEIVFLNPLRNEPDAALKRRVTIGEKVGFGIQAASQGKSGAGEFVDYRGEQVIGAFRYIPFLDWGLVAKIDTQEAFVDVINLKRLIGIILIIVFVLSAITAFSIARSISGPIKKLARGVEIAGSGNLDHKVAVNSKDEIGQLSRSFDKMTQDLKRVLASRDELNQEVLERKKAEEALQENEERLKRAQEIAHLGSWELDLVKNRLSWSDEAYRIFGLRPQEFSATYDAFLEAVHPDDRQSVNDAYSNSIREGRSSYEIEHRIIRKSSGEIRVVHEKCEHIQDASGSIVRSIGMVHDITERKRADEELRRSNENLEEFAYVASHDLQEPLRMMASYAGLLERRYRHKLDQDADEFIGYIVDGAKRLQGLINDLLAYSRIGRMDKPANRFDCNTVLRQVLASMAKIIEENKALITSDHLPELVGNESNFVQLFQNLIGNAVKFHAKEPPHIHLSAAKKDSEWVFSVKDNGIGIEPQYQERIFMIFQRLHARDEYPGTGIGLSICKKIIETQGGRIWVESETGKGSAFYFTVPVKEGVKHG